MCFEKVIAMYKNYIPYPTLTYLRCMAVVPFSVKDSTGHYWIITIFFVNIVKVKMELFQRIFPFQNRVGS